MNKIRVRFLMFAVVVVTAIYSTVANTLGTLSQREEKNIALIVNLKKKLN